MVEQLETAADLSEIGILMDPAGEQDEEDALEEGEHEDETLENLNPKHYEFPEPAQESSLFRKIEYKDKTLPKALRTQALTTLTSNFV